MAGMSVDGLVSGLDTTNLVAQLMQLEKQPQVRLQTTLTKVNTQVSTYQTLNTRALAVKTAAEALTKPEHLQATKATSSAATTATATSSPTAAPGSLTFKVTQLAAAHTTISAGAVAGRDAVAANGDLTLTVGGVEHTLTAGDTGTFTLDQLATAINGADAGVRATAVQVSPGSFKLQLASTTTGVSASFSLAPADPADTEALAPLRGTAAGGAELTTVTAGRDASITVGEGTGAYTITRPTNAMADVLPGVTINLVKVDTAPVTVEVGTDTAATTDKVGKLVEAVNGVFANIKLNGSYNAETKVGGPLLGDATARQVQNTLYRAMGSVEGSRTLSSVGLSLTKDGMLSLDKDKLAKALVDDPAAVEAFFTGETGYATGLAKAAASLTDPEDPAKQTMGTITAVIKGRQSAARGLTDQIASWDSRLALREKALKRQYAALEGALGTLKNQSGWLAGQLASLPTYSSS